jgi:hypothetical protein
MSYPDEDRAGSVTGPQITVRKCSKHSVISAGTHVYLH